MKYSPLLALILVIACSGKSPTAPTAVTPPVTVAPPPVVSLWSVSGKGNTVFDMPVSVSRVRIQGTWDRTSTSNFIVDVRGRNVVNVILRDSITYDGIHLVTGGGVTEILNSQSVTWTFTQVQ